MNENYKSASLNYENELERQDNEYFNDYGYNLFDNKKRKVDTNKLILKPKRNVNKDYINIKR